MHLCRRSLTELSFLIRLNTVRLFRDIFVPKSPVYVCHMFHRLKYFVVLHYTFYLKLVECPQCYCREIRQMLTFLINISFPKGYYRPDHSIRIVKHHGEKISLNPRTFIFTVLSAVIRFKDIRQDFTHSFCMNMNNSCARSSSSC
jgi:hypothetical protein